MTRPSLHYSADEPHAQTEAKQSGGLLTLATFNALNTARPAGFDLLLDWKAANGLSAPVELQLDFQRPGIYPTSFPVASRPVYFAGVCDTDGQPHTGYGAAVVKIETGGRTPRTLYSDLRRGRWSLGSQESVKVSIAFWGLAWTDPSAFPTGMQIAGNVVPHSPLAEPLRYTMAEALDPAATLQLPIPPGAVYCELVPQPNEVNDETKFELLDGVRAVRDYSAGTFYPPWSPVAVNTEIDYVTVKNSGTHNCQFYLTFFCE